MDPGSLSQRLHIENSLFAITKSMHALTLSTSPDASPRAFHPFDSLPRELRNRIWGYTMLPRVVEILYSERKKSYLTDTPQPAALSVCQESRSEGLRLYQQLTIQDMELPYNFKRPADREVIGTERRRQGWRQSRRDKEGMASFKCYFNYKQDTLFLSDRQVPDGGFDVLPQLLESLAANPHVSRKLQHLAIQHSVFPIGEYLIQISQGGLENLAELRTVHIVYADEFHGRTVAFDPPQFESKQRSWMIRSEVGLVAGLFDRGLQVWAGDKKEALLRGLNRVKVFAAVAVREDDVFRDGRVEKYGLDRTFLQNLFECAG
jgi:hypothetical protein